MLTLDNNISIVKGYTDNCNKGVIGIIRNITNERIKIRIEIDDPWMIERHQRNCT